MQVEGCSRRCCGLRRGRGKGSVGGGLVGRGGAYVYAFERATPRGCQRSRGPSRGSHHENGRDGMWKPPACDGEQPLTMHMRSMVLSNWRGNSTRCSTQTRTLEHGAMVRRLDSVWNI